MIDLKPVEAVLGNTLHRQTAKKPTRIPGYDEISNRGWREGRRLGMTTALGGGKTAPGGGTE